MTFVDHSSKMSPSRPSYSGKKKMEEDQIEGRGVADQTKSVKTLWIQWESLEVKNGILFHE